MMAGRGSTAAVGGPARHIPVMLSEVLAQLDPKDGEIIVDGTFGAGGYSQAILESRRLQDHRHRSRSRSLSPERRVGDSLSRKGAGGARPLQRDGRARRERRFQLRRGRRARSRRLLDAARRAEPAGSPSARTAPSTCAWGRRGLRRATSSTRLGEQELAEIIFKLGEERRSRAIAKAIVKRRAEAPIATTAELADIVAGVLGAHARREEAPRHPHFSGACGFISTRSSTSSRAASPPPSVCWKAGGRLAVVTFHSLEDRIAKRFFASRSAPPPRASRHLPEAGGEIPAPSFRLLNRRPVEPNQAEIRRNPRARSARLRAAERTGAPAHPLDLAALGVPRLGFCM